MSTDAYTFDRVSERHLRVNDRRHLGRLLAHAFGDEEVRQAAHYGDPPSVRVIARHNGVPVAQAGVFRLRTPRESHITVLGIGDVAVHPAHRGRGLARATVTRALAIAHGQHPQLIVARSEPLKSLLARHGFRPILASALPLDDFDNWMAWTPTGELPHITELDPSDV
jgi:predicted N-acetyltransferase YhbS